MWFQLRSGPSQVLQPRHPFAFPVEDQTAGAMRAKEHINGQWGL